MGRRLEQRRECRPDNDDDDNDDEDNDNDNMVPLLDNFEID